MKGGWQDSVRGESEISPTQMVGWYSNTSTFVLELPAGSRWIRKLHRNFARCPS